MAAFDFSTRRLFVAPPLAAGAEIELTRSQAHYLLTVLRLPHGHALPVFNGRDGEWRAVVEATGRRAALLRISERLRPQPPAPDLLYLFAPLKHARLDYMVEKAVEMGVGQLAPVLTRRTTPSRTNLERMRANAIEAAEQCGVLHLPEIVPPRPLPAALASLAPDRLLVICDEEAPVADAVEALRATPAGTGLAILVGPEGGFDAEERALALRHPRVCRLSLGPRILRADTAAVAVLALVQAVLGDWR